MTEHPRTREQRVRRAAARQGLRLERNRVRDPRALDFGTYRLVDTFTGVATHSNTRTGYGLTLDDVERILNERAPATRERSS